MALLIAPGVRVIDDDGNLISGGKIRVYDANTTDLSDIFSDEGLSVPLPNPVIANAAGWPSSNGTTPALIFAATGTYDVAFLDSDNTVMATFSDVSTFGEEGGELSRTVSGGGRFLVTGSAGAVMIQAGDPDPDNTGGTLTIEGQAGTQLDSLTLDAALANVTGRLKEQGKKITGVVYTEATTFTAASNVAVALPNDPSGVTMYEVDFWDLAQSGSDDLIVQFSYDGGGTYASGVADYAWVRGFSGSSSGATSGTDTSDSRIQLMSGTAGASNKPAKFTLRISTPDSGNNCTLVDWLGAGVSSTEHYRVSGMGYGPASSGRATHVRLDTSGTNTLNGKYRVKIERGSGDA